MPQERPGRPRAADHPATRDRDAAWTLCHIDGEPIESIAARAGCDPRTVEGGVSRGLARLKKGIRRALSLIGTDPSTAPAPQPEPDTHRRPGAVPSSPGGSRTRSPRDLPGQALLFTP